jgi:hypothetical protein
MTSYGTVAQVQDLVPLVTIGVSTVPDSVQVQSYLDNRSAEIDGVLAALGFQTPIPAGTFATDLGQLNAIAAAGDVWLAAFIAAPGINAVANGEARLKEYQTRLGEMRQGIGVPVGQAYAEADRAPRSYFVDTASIGQLLDAVDAWGDRVRSNPALRRGRVY